MDSSAVDGIATISSEESFPAVGREAIAEGMELKVRNIEEGQQQGDSTPADAPNSLRGTGEESVDLQKEIGSGELEEIVAAAKEETLGKEEEIEKEKAGLKRKKLDEDDIAAFVPDGVQASQGASQDTRETRDAKKPARYKKRKIAIFVSYSGYGYQGMQRNKGCKTIEGDLEEALFKAGAIAESTFGDPRKIDWARAARTDKGVSAAGQVVSGRFFVDPPGFVERVNSHLPKQIRVLGFTRVTGTFSAKNLCDRRRYEYVLPVFALDPASHRVESPTIEAANPGDNPGEAITSEDVEEDTTSTTGTTTGRFTPTCTCTSSDLETGFTFGDEERAKLTKILQNYVGTRYFHNFTCRVKPEDPSTQRYITSYEAGEVFTIQGCKFVRCTVIGQSFMLHQIRKMIGLAVAVMRGDAPETIFERAFRRDTKIGVPMAPELGLFLDECLYTAYNQRFAGSHEEVSLKSFEKEIAEFKTEVIYPHIASTEAKDGVFARWLHGLTKERYPDFAAQAPPS
ncbi:tRNA pseudouridine synthase A [Selaginella moellendorffii]|nr:tRNA pseudouridine synthase A [Selaginella moellendorffii]|eukprot:XP_002985091.2 tRNA pseudouridine synthase A [Selaginella moellendorffii]